MEIINILTSIDTIKLAAGQAIAAIIILPLASVWCFQFDGIYIGATASKAMMVTMAIAFFVPGVRVCAAIVLSVGALRQSWW